ncbi:thioesterase II family protein [Pseudoalteromonas denitrificans]|uniref:Surfactin synthase thioesterase subunit n=1 Tax=Pseudoalteromonas denitrificans DSM 6059 TaxID=1123010 RepID=A0A1I1QCB0_9GAMM|nr:thioesterase domain-containing protein [Pseudoalteromonas denitrificans]SFD15750.1 Surfactin synthase thioesterase subunit [Pseudoalteromonas denitrificans DSM 6059]
MQSKWFVIPKHNPQADIRLICFPYAGGSSSIYTSWVNSLPENVELIIMQAPGRSNRMFETPIDKMDILADNLLAEIPTLLNKPYVLFGHSLGSRVCFELILRLNKLGLQLPLHFIASGSSGPQKERHNISYNLPESEFISKLRTMNGTPEELLKNKELMSLLLPMLRADFEIAETFQYTGNALFNISLSIFGGEDDTDVTNDDLYLWQQFFKPKAKTTKFPGGHFFINSHKELVLEKVNKVLSMYINKTIPC